MPSINFVSCYQPVVVVNSTGAVASTSQGATNVWNVGGANLEVFNNTAITNAAPLLSSNANSGLNIDNVTGAASKIIEITLGNSPSAINYISNTSPAFYLQASFNVNTVADVTDLFIGFRKQQAYQTALASYTDYATIGVVGTGGAIELQTQKTSLGNTTTNTTNTITASTVFTVEVLVDGSGNVTYLFNGSPPSVVAAYQFTAALTLIPFIWYATPAGGHAEVDLFSIATGLQ